METNKTPKHARIATALVLACLAIGAAPMAAAETTLDLADDGDCYYINIWCTPIPCFSLSNDPVNDCT